MNGQPDHTSSWKVDDANRSSRHRSFVAAVPQVRAAAKANLDYVNGCCKPPILLRNALTGEMIGNSSADIVLTQPL